MTDNEVHLQPFEFKIHSDVIHLRTISSDKTFFLCAWCIPNFSSAQTRSTQGFSDWHRWPHRSYSIKLNVNPGHAKIEIYGQNFSFHEWDFSISSHAGKVKLTKHSNLFAHEYRYSACVEGLEFQKLEKLHNSSCIIICRMTQSRDYNLEKCTARNISGENAKYLKSLEVAVKNSGVSSKEKVTLRIGEETEIINKAVLCARSPVFAKMFASDMRELREKTVTITDIKMPVLKILVSFLYSGILTDCDYDAVCDLYYVADKYVIKELQEACIGSLLTKISHKNIFQVLKLSVSHNDEFLKSAVMTLISANIKTIVFTSDWKNLMHEDSELALEASTYFDL